MSAVLTHKSACRICHGARLALVFSFGPTPLANAFLKADEIRDMEPYFPLDVYLCTDCGLPQLLDIVAPEVLFKGYIYVSSTSPVFVAHFEKFAESVCKRFQLALESLVVDIGSNDGILLRQFKEKGVRVLGVEPDKAIARVAKKAGVETLVRFFDNDVAAAILKQYGKADVITATNVFAHVDDIHGMVNEVKQLLKKDGVFIIEVPYLVDFLKKNLFDTVYHEHLSYFSVSTLNAFFERAGMVIFDVEKVSSHGGSLRVFIEKRGASHAVSPRVQSFMRAEKKFKLLREKTYHTYALRIQKIRAKLTSLLTGLKERGKTIAGYGAPAKGNTLLNFFSIGRDLLSYIIDDSKLKQGMFTPGKRIPVISSEVLRKNPPDYLLIIAWNFADSIIEKNESFIKNGGKFIIPVPYPRIV